MATISGNLADGKPMQYGGFYNGQAWDGSKLLAPGLDVKGNRISNEVIAQTNPNNVQYVQQQTQAQDLRAPANVPYSSGANGQYIGSISGDVEKYRIELESQIQKQKEENDRKMAEKRKVEQETLTKVGELTTPFREDLEKTERERLYINENFEANQKLVNELDTLLTEGNEAIRAQKEVTGLAAVRNPRIQKTMDDVAARAGVIQAVMSARNGQIAQASNLIDRSINAIVADRQDRLTYYETILNMNNRDILSLDADAKNLAQEEVNIAKSFLADAQQNANYLKQLMMNPATASLIGEAGVTLADSPDVITQKLSQASYQKQVNAFTNEMSLAGNTPVYDPLSVPANQLITLTDDRGVKHHFQKEVKPVSTEVSVENFNSQFTAVGSSTKSVDKPPEGPWKIGAITYFNGRAWIYTASGWRPK